MRAMSLNLLRHHGASVARGRRIDEPVGGVMASDHHGVVADLTA